MRPTRSPVSPTHGEAGSAYVVALLVLVVLSIVGLSLSVITQTEMQVGSNERTAQRVFYAADSGIGAATARSLVTADFEAQCLTIPDSNSALLNLRQRVAVSAFRPILSAPCHLCEINNSGQYGTKNYQKITHGVTTNAERLSGVSRVHARSFLSAMVDIEPREATPEAYVDNSNGASPCS